MENKNAVTPIVATIMLVAITVCLAAVVAAFLFGFAGQTLQSLQTTKIVSATMQRTDTSHVSVTYYGGQDASALAGMQFTVNGAANVTVSTGSSSVTASGNQVNASAGMIPVGLVVTVPATNPKKDHIVITGLFSDGSSAIIAESIL